MDHSSRGISALRIVVVSLGENVVAVRAITDFVPINQQNQAQEATQMSKERVEALIGNEKSRFSAADTDYLMGLTDEELVIAEKMPDVEVKAATEEEGTSSESQPAKGEPAEEETPALETEGDAVGEAGSPEAFLAGAPSEIQEVLTAGLEMHRSKKAHLIKELAANPRNTFTEEQMNSWDIKQLEGMAQIANVPTYEGRNSGVVDPAIRAAEDAKVPPPLKVFEGKSAKSA